MRTPLLLAVLTAIAIATWLYNRPSTTETVGRFRGEAAPLGYYLKGARMLGTDANGRVSYRLVAERLEEKPSDELLLLSGVHMEYLPADDDEWVIVAAAASAPKDASELELKGGVEVRSNPATGVAPTIISAETLRFLPKTSSAETDDEVHIRVGDWQLNATGLRTLLKADTLQLESKVHGKFAP